MVLLLLLGGAFALAGLSQAVFDGSDDETSFERTTVEINEDAEFLTFSGKEYSSSSENQFVGFNSDASSSDQEAEVVIETEVVTEIEDQASLEAQEAPTDVNEPETAEDISEEQTDGSRKRATSGDDVLFGTDGDDRFIDGEEGNDRIFLRGGDDTIDPFLVSDAAGDDFIRGGGGDDEITDPIGNDTLLGDDGHDTLDTTDEVGYAGADLANGGAGDDVIFGDDGDLLVGGTGSDTFYTRVFDGRDADVVTIQDFDPRVDVLKISPQSDSLIDYNTYDITLARAGDDSGTIISLSGTPIALVLGAEIPEFSVESFYIFGSA